jgi:cell fate (sporulation/competence/biofilm development) regulator YlbF (YheA/YmcA/DUF963 family)
MKRLLLFVTTLFVLAGCKTSKDYLSRADEDRTLFDVVKRLDKKSSDEDALKALPEVYKAVQQKHLRKIASLQNSKELNRWDKLLEEYNALQNMYEAINNVDAAARLVNATSYATEMYETKQNAADAYYNEAAALLQSNYRDDIKRSYNYFKKADKWVSGYKDARSKMDEAYQNATVDVLINPVQDNSFFFNTGWGNTGYNYSNEYFQQNLVRDLGGKYASRYPARFYTEWEARRDNVKPQWVVDLTLRNLDIPRPYTNNYSRSVNKRIENGKDTSGKPVYQTVYATLQISKQSFTARAQMDVNITDVITRKNISYNSYSDDFRWEEERATYTGDSRALDNNDWALINNSRYNQQPRKEEVLNELYRKIYPQVKNRISYSVDW